MTTHVLLEALRTRIKSQITLNEVHLVEGNPVSYLVASAKGIRALIGYRGETPQRRNASSTTDLRAVRLAVSLMQTHSGKTSTEGEVKAVNDAMDDVVTTIEDTGSLPRWWSALSGVCGAQLSEIQALSSPEGDFTGRDILFTFLVDANA